MYNIAIIAAMDEEADIIINNYLENKEPTIQIAGCAFTSGYIDGTKIIVARSGIGKVNAAVCAQLLITKFDVKYIINSGVAGSLAEKLDIGDVVLCSEYIYSDVDCTCFSYEYGQVPRMPKSYHSSQYLIDAAKKASSEIKSEHKFHIGKIATGDSFVVEKITRDEINNKTGSICVDMESSSYAQVCYLNNVEFLAIRSISDTSDGRAVVAFDEFVHHAAQNSADLVINIIKEISR